MSLSRFAAKDYRLHNAARLTHLGSLKLPLAGRRVFETGSGPGDHTAFYLRLNCKVVSTDARPECVSALAARYPNVQTRVLDLNNVVELEPELGRFDIVHCYGTLYHLGNPAAAIDMLAPICDGLFLIETCVSLEPGENVYQTAEVKQDFTQSSTGVGSRPTRGWILAKLREHFPFAYQTRTQPKHGEFPLDWTTANPRVLNRAVFVGSRTALDESVFSAELLDVQTH